VGQVTVLGSVLANAVERQDLGGLHPHERAESLVGETESCDPLDSATD
jgi:hypothetical protein